MTRSALAHLLLDVGAVRHHGRDVAAEDVVHVAQPGRDCTSRMLTCAPTPTATWQALVPAMPAPRITTLPAARRRRRRAARRGRRSGLEAPRADLDREAPGDLAHRREQRQRAVVELDRLVAERAHAALDQRARQRLVGREVEVGEEHQTGPQMSETPAQRLLHLEDQLGALPHLGGASASVAPAAT